MNKFSFLWRKNTNMVFPHYCRKVGFLDILSLSLNEKRTNTYTLKTNLDKNDVNVLYLLFIDINFTLVFPCFQFWFHQQLHWYLFPTYSWHNLGQFNKMLFAIKSFEFCFVKSASKMLENKLLVTLRTKRW